MWFNSTIGELLAKETNCKFIDADDFHPQSNKGSYSNKGDKSNKGKHFMPATLLRSQLELLQIDDSGGIMKVDATLSPQIIVETIQDLIFKVKM